MHQTPQEISTEAMPWATKVAVWLTARYWLCICTGRVSLKQLLLHKSWDCHKQMRYEQWKCHTLVFHFPLEVQRYSRQFSKCSLTESLQRSARFGSFVLIEVSVTFVTTSFKTPTSAVKALPSL